MTTDYARALGSRLRAIRTQQGLSLHGVEEKSQGRWKAVVVGSYERGDRAVTVQRLAELADFYGVPVASCCPGAAPRLARNRRRGWSSTWSGSGACPPRRPDRSRATARRSRASAATTTARCCRSARTTCARSASSTTSHPAVLVEQFITLGRARRRGPPRARRRLTPHHARRFPQTGALCTRHGRVLYTGHRFARVTEGAPRSTAVG